MDATDNRLLATQYYGCWVVDLYHLERNHQGLDNALIDSADCPVGNDASMVPYAVE